MKGKIPNHEILLLLIFYIVNIRIYVATTIENITIFRLIGLARIFRRGYLESRPPAKVRRPSRLRPHSCMLIVLLYYLRSFPEDEIFVL